MVAKGFKKRYFSLQAITATVSYVLILKIGSVYREFARIMAFRGLLGGKECEADPPDASEALLLSKKPCFCNIFFACKAHNVLKLSKINKPPLCRCRYTKTGIAPPELFFD